MMKKALLPFLVLFVAIAILLATGLGNREKFNIDVTMVVDTPNGRISQSSVVGYYSAAYPKRLHKNNYSTLRIFGSAPYAEISPEQYLFALNLYEPYNILKTYSDHYGLQNGIDQTLIKQIVSDKSRPKLKSR